MELDRAAEAVVFAELEALAERGEKFSVLSEEAGTRSFGAEYPLVLVDPVDGSLNAKQGCRSSVSCSRSSTDRPWTTRSRASS